MEVDPMDTPNSAQASEGDTHEESLLRVRQKATLVKVIQSAAARKAKISKPKSVDDLNLGLVFSMERV